MRLLVNLAISCLLGTITAQGQIAPQVDALETVELLSKDVSLPSSTAGSLSFRRCQRCPLITVTGNSQTRYRVGNTDVGFEQFRAAVAAPGMGLMLDYQVVSRRIFRLTAQRATAN